MFRYTLQLYENGTWGTLDNWARPFTDGASLDETLDSGRINISNTTRSAKIKPFTRLRITIEESADGNTWTYKGKIQRVVADSKITRKRMCQNSVTYDWTISTVELTKLLERDVLSSMTVTKYLTKIYNGGFNVASYTINTQGLIQSVDRNSVIRTPYETNTAITFASVENVLEKPTSSINQYRWTSGSIVINDGGSQTTLGINGGTYTPTNVGTMSVLYQGVIHDSVSQIDTPCSVTFSIGIFKKIDSKTNPTIPSVINRLLSAGRTRRKLTSQKYTLNSTFATKYASVESPEFSFGNCTLFEALLQIGYKIHAIPRLQCVNESSSSTDTTYEVVFDELGGHETMTNLPAVVFEERTYNANDYCGELDCPAQNLINTLDDNAGAITELGGDYITVRTDNAGIEISADTAIIRTSLPIYKIIKVECGYINNSTIVGDITPYIYESGEYKTLSSYGGTAFPYAKKYALYYSQGGNTIGGLMFKATEVVSSQTAFSDPAIINIIKAKGYTASSTDLINFAFKVTYVPIVASRVTQRKSQTGYDNKNSITFNQGASQVETSAFGERLRGAIARLGLEAVTRTYDFTTWSALPTVGKLIDGKYIASVNNSYDKYKIRSTVLLTENFNMLSQYVGLDSQWRLYDVSERQAVDRNINYGENVYIGTDEYANINTLVGGYRLQNMLKQTLGRTGESTSIKFVKAIPQDSTATALSGVSPCILPVASFGLGNSIVFSYTYMDNYGAGYQSTNQYSEGSVYKRVQREVPYSDAYGELYHLKLDYYTGGAWTATRAEQLDGGKANLYPEGNYNVSGTAALTTGTNSLVIQKDSKEHISVTIQVHFVANKNSIVIGSALANNNSLVKDVNSSVTPVNYPAAYVFNHKLNELDGHIDLTGANRIGYLSESNIIYDNGSVYITGLTNTSGAEAQAWGIIDESNNTLYLGENVTIANGAAVPNIYFTTQIE